MTTEREQIFSKYIAHIYTTTRSYDHIGRSIKAVKDFLGEAEAINKRGYNRYMKTHMALMVQDAYRKEALLEFLDWKGIGYRRTRKLKEVKPLEKLSVISDKNRKLMNDFLAHLEETEDYSPHTMDLYAYSVKKYFEYANEISTDNYKRFVRTLEEKGYSPKTIRLRITGIERLSEFAGKPVKLKRPKIPKSLDTNNVPTEAEYNRLLEYLQTKANRDYYFYIRILATTGARVSEFFQFRWEDIMTGEVTLKGKGNKYRRFFFNKQLQQEVGKYIEEKHKAGYVAVSRFGRLTQRGLCQAMKVWGAHCGIDARKMHPHAFRHFFAKMFLRKNKDVIQLADLLGHHSVDTTRIYLQRSYDEQKRDFNRNVTW